jgi:hypothetical protein
MASPERTVPGHHGTRCEWVEKIEDEGFRSSASGADWLGDGSYFFEDAPSMADEWARMVHPGHATCVLGAEIRLRHCLDLLDSRGAAVLEPFYEKQIAVLGRRQIAQLKQKETDAYGDFDCGVINLACLTLAEDGGTVVEVVRAACRAGGALYEDPSGELPRSRFDKKDHIQLAVRENCAILALRREEDPTDGRRAHEPG